MSRRASRRWRWPHSSRWRLTTSRSATLRWGCGFSWPPSAHVGFLPAHSSSGKDIARAVFEGVGAIQRRRVSHDRPVKGGRGHGGLVLAIEHAAQAPAMEQLAASAAASSLGLIVIFWAGGWLPLTITIALLILAIPLYRRAGTRSEAMNVAYQVRRRTLEERQLEICCTLPNCAPSAPLTTARTRLGRSPTASTSSRCDQSAWRSSQCWLRNSSAA